MLIMFVRAVILYIFAVAAMRLMGKRQVGQLQPFELVVVIIIAELAATPLEDTGKPMLYGIVPMAALIVCHSILSWLLMVSQPARKWVCGQPTVLVRHGVICEKQLRRMAVTLNDLTEMLRMGGVQDLSQVESAVLETGGSVSVFPKAADRPLTPRDMGVTPPEESLPFPLILDGVLQRDNLAHAGYDERRLKEILRRFGFKSEKEVLFMSINSQREILCQGKGQMKTAVIREDA